MFSAIHYVQAERLILLTCNSIEPFARVQPEEASYRYMVMGGILKKCHKAGFLILAIPINLSGRILVP